MLKDHRAVFAKVILEHQLVLVGDPSHDKERIVRCIGRERRQTPDRRTVTRTQLWEAFAKGGNKLRQE